MKKKNNGWIAAGLFTIATTIATVYTLLEYRESVLIVGIASLLLLLSAFWLFSSISRLIKKEPEISVGQEQRERMNYEGMKLQGEELIRLVNSFGKGTYVYSKRSAEKLQAILEYSIQTQHTNEQLINDLIQNQTKTAKFQVKYSQEDTTALIQAFAEQCRLINDNLVKCVNDIESQNIEMISRQPQPDGNVSNSLNDLSLELAHINTSIQALQLQLATAFQPTAMYAQNQPASVQSASVPTASMTAEPPMDETPSFGKESPVEDALTEELPDTDEASFAEEALTEAELPVTEEAAFAEELPNTDELSFAEEALTEAELPVAEDASFAEELPNTDEASFAEEALTEAELPVTEETAFAEESPATEESSIGDELSNIIEFTASEKSDSTEDVTTTEEPAIAVAKEPVVTPPSDNPNKQLSADEIAALFASLG